LRYGTPLLYGETEFPSRSVQENLSDTDEDYLDVADDESDTQEEETINLLRHEKNVWEHKFLLPEYPYPDRTQIRRRRNQILNINEIHRRFQDRSGYYTDPIRPEEPTDDELTKILWIFAWSTLDEHDDMVTQLYTLQNTRDRVEIGMLTEENLAWLVTPDRDRMLWEEHSRYSEPGNQASSFMESLTTSGRQYSHESIEPVVSELENNFMWKEVEEMVKAYEDVFLLKQGRSIPIEDYVARRNYPDNWFRLREYDIEIFEPQGRIVQPFTSSQVESAIARLLYRQPRNTKEWHIYLSLFPHIYNHLSRQYNPWKWWRAPRLLSWYIGLFRLNRFSGPGETFEDPTSARPIPKIWKTLMMPGAGDRSPLQVLEHVKRLLQQGPRTRDLPLFRYMFPEIFPGMIPFPLHRHPQRWPEGIPQIDIRTFNEVHKARYESVNMPH
jgi:hypothetical protein